MCHCCYVQLPGAIVHGKGFRDRKGNSMKASLALFVIIIFVAMAIWYKYGA